MIFIRSKNLFESFEFKVILSDDRTKKILEMNQSELKKIIAELQILTNKGQYIYAMTLYKIN